MNQKNRQFFNNFFLSNDREYILKSSGKSTKNIRINVKYYNAINLIALYAKFAFIPKQDLNREIDRLDNLDNNFEVYLASSIYNNYNKILRYKDMVEMANTLG